MKKILLMMLITFSLSTQAESLTATLQKEDKVTLFRGVDAFKNAYEAADDGSVISLSLGLFNTVEKIEKSVSIIGTNGFEDVKRTTLASLTIAANNVKVEGIYFSSNVSIGSATNCHVSKCKILGTLSSTDTHINTVVDQCYVNSLSAISNGVNFCLKNSVVMGFSASNAVTNMAYITNCTLRGFSYFPYAVYKNNLMHVKGTFNAPSQFYNNVYTNGGSVSYENGALQRNNWTASVSFTNNDYFTPTNPGNGEDGTPVGPQGGSGYSPHPSVPRVTSLTIATNTDASGNLDIYLEVQAER